ncbi:ABC transporter substrate-binding protein [Pseudonocardia alni]|uniref:NitT/TauT family transport system substrate-binding protein n=1 Tax=Pseudonocardia alni TaxID=33907 RepID=A0AA44UM05_PSEA5|nr:ABC transporter substrate-binding protein [Pseudonocardia alni]PKB29538.1 NitT/TauT family transport system substrate-binding protein [Pseudonocardia alni]
MTRTTTRLAAVLLAACLALAGCGAGGGEDGRDRIIFLNILPMESLGYAAEMIADTKGYFAAHGLDVTFEATQGSAPAIQTLLAGSAEISRIGDIETMVAAGERGAPLVAIGGVVHNGPLRLVSSQRAPVTDAAQLRGKLVGTPSEGGTSSITLDLVAGSAGIAPAELRRQVVGLSPGVFDLVNTGRVDAFIVSLDTAMLLQATRPEAVVYDPNDAISAGSQIYATSKATATDPQEQDKLRRYLAAIADATAFITADEANGFAETMQLIGSKYQVSALDRPEVARAALASYVDGYAAGQGPTGIAPQRWQATYDEVSSVGQVPAGLDPAQWLDAGLNGTEGAR